MKTKLRVIKDDITKLKVDAIVNAANKTLLGGGGVDGAIHGGAGPELLEECKTLGGCEAGEAKITRGYNLPAKYIIHTVGPVYGSEKGQEEELLASCYKNSLLIAEKEGIKTIAFPCISTGVFKFPKDKAAQIAINTVKSFIQEHPGVFEEITFVTFSELDLGIYRERQLLEINKKLLDFVDNSFKPKNVNTVDIIQLVSIFLLAKSTKTFRALYILCSEGYGQDAAILARSILENYINLAYMNENDKQNRAKLFVNHSLIDRKNKVERMKKNENLKEYLVKENIEEKFRKQFGKQLSEAEEMHNKEFGNIKEMGGVSPDRNRWSCLSIREMIKKFDNERSEFEYLYYEQVYWLVSQFSHPDVASSNNYLINEENNLLIKDMPNNDWVKEALSLGFDCYFKIIELLNEILELGFESKIENFEKEYMEISGKKI